MKLVAAFGAAAVVLAGCGSSGGGARLDRADAAPLIALAGRIAHEGACAQAKDIPKLRTQAVALVNARRVPFALQEQLVSAVNALGAETPLCLPPAPAAATTTVTRTPSPPAAPSAPSRARHHAPPGHGRYRHGHGHGHH